MSYYEWRPYIPVAAKQQQAERKLAKLKKQGQSVAPVRIAGRTIAKSFWGKSWCVNLERYSGEPPAARPDLCPKRFGHRSANRQGRNRGHGRRL